MVKVQDPKLELIHSLMFSSYPLQMSCLENLLEQIIHYHVQDKAAICVTPHPPVLTSQVPHNLLSIH